MNKRIVALVVIVLLAVSFAFWIIQKDGEPKCVRVDVGCCSCANGGEEICVLEKVAEQIEKDKNCGGDVFCAAVYSCNISSCDYIDGECVAK